ncbi:MAG: T9SS type A sorting domain-containing protein, partial [Bacteroidota bacterium]
QDQGACDGQRYRFEVFSSTDSTLDVQFGENTTAAGTQQSLLMDIYEPSGDTASARTVVVLAFGGAFISGDRKQLKELCEVLARRGFVAASIDYRLYDKPLFPIPTQEDILDAVIKAIGDMKAAVRFFREEAANDNSYRIDSNSIFVGGISAGAITAGHVAMLDSTDSPDSLIQAIIANNGGWEGNSSTNVNYSSAVSGLISYSGALVDASWIDANDPPFVAFHDDMDPIVPYGDGQFRLGLIPILDGEGSLSMTKRADSVGIFSQLFTVENSDGHVSYLTTTDELADSTSDFTADFLYEVLCSELLANVESPSNPQSDLTAYPNPTDGLLYIKNTGIPIVQMKLFNTMGQRVNQWPAQTAIDLTGLEPGMYILEVVYARGAQPTLTKVVKQ